MIFLEERNSDSMASTTPPRGLIVDLITPLKDEVTIDRKGLENMIERVLPHVEGLLIGSPDGGEAHRLDKVTRATLFGKALEIVSGRTTILGWISGMTKEETLAVFSLMNKALEQGNYAGTVYWVDSPLFYHSNRGLPDMYDRLCSLTDRDVVLFNHPGLVNTLGKSFKRSNIRTSVFKDLIKNRNISGLIHQGTLDRSRNYQKALKTRSNFRIYDGQESRFLDHPSRSGVVSVGTNLSPRAWAKMTASSLNLESREKGYPDYLSQIWELGALLHKMMVQYGKNPGPVIKAVLADMGIIESPFSLLPSDNIGEQVKTLRTILEEFTGSRVFP
jgi:dihydrodipicolinate synthase/N-acetylneuraminate lyase